MNLKKLREKSNRIWPILKRQNFLIISNAISSSFAGAIWPVYGILQADSIDALSKPLMNEVKEEGFLVAMYFLCLAAVSAVAFFLQE